MNYTLERSACRIFFFAGCATDFAAAGIYKNKVRRLDILNSCLIEHRRRYGNALAFDCKGVDTLAEALRLGEVEIIRYGEGFEIFRYPRFEQLNEKEN